MSIVLKGNLVHTITFDLSNYLKVKVSLNLQGCDFVCQRARIVKNRPLPYQLTIKGLRHRLNPLIISWGCKVTESPD